MPSGSFQGPWTSLVTTWNCYLKPIQTLELDTMGEQVWRYYLQGWLVYFNLSKMETDLAATLLRLRSWLAWGNQQRRCRQTRGNRYVFSLNCWKSFHNRPFGSFWVLFLDWQFQKMTIGITKKQWPWFRGVFLGCILSELVEFENDRKSET